MTGIIRTMFDIQMDQYRAQYPTAQLNKELFELLCQDCEVLDNKIDELKIAEVEMEFSEDRRDAIMCFKLDELILTRDSDLLSIFSHASDIDFSKDEEMLAVTLTYAGFSEI